MKKKTVPLRGNQPWEHVQPFPGPIEFLMLGEISPVGSPRKQGPVSQGPVSP